MITQTVTLYNLCDWKISSGSVLLRDALSPKSATAGAAWETN